MILLTKWKISFRGKDCQQKVYNFVQSEKKVIFHWQKMQKNGLVDQTHEKTKKNDEIKKTIY